MKICRADPGVVEKLHASSKSDLDAVILRGRRPWKPSAWRSYSMWYYRRHARRDIQFTANFCPVAVIKIVRGRAP